MDGTLVWRRQVDRLIPQERAAAALDRVSAPFEPIGIIPRRAVLSIAPTPTIFLHTDATDMRKRFTGLFGLIRGVFGDEPTEGSLFLFVNKRRDRIKALWWDHDGFVLWYKRLEQGTFEVGPMALLPLGRRWPRCAASMGKKPSMVQVHSPRSSTR